jgi:hypothetical protein
MPISSVIELRRSFSTRSLNAYTIADGVEQDVHVVTTGLPHRETGKSIVIDELSFSG